MGAYTSSTILKREGLAEAGILTPAARGSADTFRVRYTDSLVEVEAAWRQLEAQGIDSPGQSFEFTRIWVETFEIPRAEQVYVTVESGRRALIVLALRRRVRAGVVMLEPFAGHHVGVNGPLIDRARMGKLDPQERDQVWRKILGSLKADVLRLGRVKADDLNWLGAGVRAMPADFLYRTAFSSWEDCDREQRNRNRRKHDKQQGAKLAAMGEVSFEELDGSDKVCTALDILFADRAARFAEQGITDPFASPQVRAFYRSVFSGNGGLKGKLHLLRLDRKIVAARYNLVAGDKMFCLISSMNMAPELQPGSPGKQILVHLMQRIFGQGIRVFDMGAGLTDEKRHWCNQQLPLADVAVPLTFAGQAVCLGLELKCRTKAIIKSNAHLFEMAKSWRARLKR